MNKKTEVLRLTITESKLVKKIREVGITEFLCDIERALITSSEPLTSLRGIKGSLSRSKYFSFEDIVSNKSLSKEDASYLIDAVRLRKSIAITGGVGTGKTTLLKALLACSEMRDNRLCIFEGREESEPCFSLINKSSVHVDPENTSVKDLLELAFRGDIDQLVFADVKTQEDILSLALLAPYKPTIFTVISDDYLKGVLTSLNGNAVNSVISAIDKENLVEVTCSYDGEQHTFSVLRNVCKLAG
jgi:hypothetical protein